MALMGLAAQGRGSSIMALGGSSIMALMGWAALATLAGHWWASTGWATLGYTGMACGMTVMWLGCHVAWPAAGH